MNDINTEYLEQEYQDTLVAIEDAVEELSRDGRLPVGFVFNVKQLDKLEEMLDSDDYYGEQYLLEYIETVREIDSLKQYLINYALRDRDWASGITLIANSDITSLVENEVRDEILSKIPDHVLPYVTLNIDFLIQERLQEYIAVSFRNNYYWVNTLHM